MCCAIVEAVEWKNFLLIFLFDVLNEALSGIISMEVSFPNPGEDLVMLI